MLSQTDAESKERVIANGSCLLSKSEHKYRVTLQEFDFKLQEFDFKVVHHCGRKHTNADALSHLPCKQCKRESHHPDSVTLSTIEFSQGRSRDKLSQLQRDDPVTGPVICALARKTKPDQMNLNSTVCTKQIICTMGSINSKRFSTLPSFCKC